MNDYSYISATDARKNFSETINEAMYNRPQIVKRNKNNLLLISKDSVYDMLDNFKIDITIHKGEDGVYFTENLILEDIIGYGETKDKAIDDFISALDVYAHEYYDNYSFYSKTIRGKKDLPYVFKVMCASSNESLKDMLICHDGKI